MANSTMIKVHSNTKVDRNEHRVTKTRQIDIAWCVRAWEAGTVGIMTPKTLVMANITYQTSTGDEYVLVDAMMTWEHLQDAFPGIHESILK
jgi:hypothetical protein